MARRARIWTAAEVATWARVRPLYTAADVAAWSARDPGMRAGKKHCGACGRAMSARDRHQQCQACRRAGGYLRWPGREQQ